MKNSLQVFSILLFFTIISKPLAAASFSEQDCRNMGAAFHDAVKAKTLLALFGETTDRLKNRHQKLRPDLQESVTIAISEIDPAVEALVAPLRNKIPEWNKRGMNGNELAKQVLMRASGDAGNSFTTNCLRAIR